jgi:hypothetical protein
MTMQPNLKFITIHDNEMHIKRLISDLILTPRIKALEWSSITKQTPNMKVGYPGQHLASLIVGMEGARTGARGHDIIDGSEVKACSRVDQLDNCANCSEKVLRIEPFCSTCGSSNIRRMGDSKWLFTIRSERDLEVLTNEVERVILTIADYPNFDEQDFETLRFQVFEIWTKSPRCARFKEIMTNYFEKIYAGHKAKDSNKTPAPKNFWPYSYQFYLCNPIRVFSCIVENANSVPNILIEYFMPPQQNRAFMRSELMPSELLNKEEWQFLVQNVPSELWNLGTEINEFIEKSKLKNLKIKELSALVPFISEEIRAYLPLRDTDKISVSKSPYLR